MKPVSSILFLGVVVTFIIVFWLKPGINTAKDTEYVRYYEDTDQKISLNPLSDTLGKKRQRKIYKSERISSRDKLTKVKPKQFSRALQFEEEVLNDSVPSIVLVTKDSTSSNP